MTRTRKAPSTARIVCLFDTAHAYSGHVIIEAYREGVWATLVSGVALVWSVRRDRWTIHAALQS